MLTVDEENKFPLKFKIQATISAYLIFFSLICELAMDDTLLLELYSFRDLVALVISDARCQRADGALAHPVIASLSSSIISSILMFESKTQREKGALQTIDQFWKSFGDAMKIQWNASALKNPSLVLWVPEIHHSILAYIANIPPGGNQNIPVLISFYQHLLREMSSGSKNVDYGNLRLIYISDHRSKSSLLIDALMTSYLYAHKLSVQLALFCGYLLFPNTNSTSPIVLYYFIENGFSEFINSSLLRHSKMITCSHVEQLFRLFCSFWIKGSEDCDKPISIASPNNITEVQLCQLFLTTWKVLWTILQLASLSTEVNVRNGHVLAFICNLFRHVLTIRGISLLLPLPGFEDREENVNPFAKYFASCEWFSILLSFIKAEITTEKRLALELIEDLLYWWTERRAFFDQTREPTSNATIIIQIRILLTSTGRLEESERKRLTSLLNTYLQLCPIRVKPIMVSSGHALASAKNVEKRLKACSDDSAMKRKTASEDPLFTSLVARHTKSSKKGGSDVDKKSGSLKFNQVNLHKYLPSYLPKGLSVAKPSLQFCPKSSFISSRLKQVRANLIKDTSLGSSSQKRIAHQKRDVVYETISTDDDEDKGDISGATTDAILALSNSKTMTDLAGASKHKPLGIDFGVQSKPIQVINGLVGISSHLNLASKTSTKTVHGTKPILDLSSLQRKILLWDLEAITEALSNHTTLQLENIPSQFTDSIHYIRIFEPLLLLECKAQITKSIEEIGGLGSKRRFNSDSSDWSEYILKSTHMIDDFYDIQFISKPSSNSHDIEGSITKKANTLDNPLSEHDLVYLESSDDSIRTSAIVMSNVFIKGGELFSTLRVCPGADGRLVSNLREGSIWKIMKVTQLVTVVREYLALSSVSSSPYLNFILNPSLLMEKKRELTMDLLENIKQLLWSAKFALNESQLMAIASALHKETQLSLIQGPPGTGKTTTLLAIVYSIFNGASFGITGPVPVSLNNSRVSHVLGLANTSISTTTPSSIRPILICAPSNAAVDEIVKRFLDSPAFVHHSIVRVGSQDLMSDDVRHISLDCLLDESEKAGKKYSAESKYSYAQYFETFYGERSSINNNLKTQLTKENIDARKRTIQSQLDEARSIFYNAVGSTSYRIEETRAAVRSRILQSASVVVATLSGSGHDFIAKLDSMLSPNSSALTSSYLYKYLIGLYSL